MGEHLDRVVALSTITRHVRTAEGAAKYNVPIGSLITLHLQAIAHAQAQMQSNTKSGTLSNTAKPDISLRDSATPKPVEGVISPPVANKPQSRRNTVGMHSVADDDKETRASFAKLAGRPIPPAWTEVFLANDPHTAKVLAIGRDAKGRAVSMPSASAMEAGAADKFDRVKEVAKVMPRLDEALSRDKMKNDTAAATFVMRRMGIRVGSTTDTRAKVQAYGTTTLQAGHVKVDGDTVTFAFTGKKGVQIKLVQSGDPELAHLMLKYLAGKKPEDRLFDTTPEKTIQYIRSATGNGKMKNHDLRTHLANVEALKAIAKYGSIEPKSHAEFTRLRNEVGDVVSAKLGNNRTEAIKSYINPDVWLKWNPNGEWL